MKKKLFRYKRFWLAALILAYLLLGFFYLPGVLSSQLQQQAREQLNMGLSIDEVHFNPLTFVTRLTGLELTDSQQHPWFTADQLRLNFDPSHLLWGQWQVSELSLTRPAIEIRTAASGEWLVPNVQLPERPSEEGTTEPNYAVANISITGGTMELSAGQISQAFALDIKQLEVSHEQFNPNDIDTAFSISILTQQDEQLQLNGHYNHPQANITTALNLSNWQSTTLLQLLPEGHSLSSDQGQLSANGSLDWALGGQPVLQLTELYWNNWQLNWSDQVSVSQLNSQWQGLTVDTAARQIRLAALNSEQANWQLNWPVVLPEPATTEDNPDEPGWNISLAVVNLKDWPLKLTDQTLGAELEGVLQQLTLNNLNNRLEGLEVDSLWRLNQGGDVRISGQTADQAEVFNAQLDINQLALPALNPWTAAASGLVVNRGMLNSQQQLSHDATGWQADGQLMVTDAALNNTAGQEVARLGTLEVADTRVNSRDRSIVIDQITLDQAQGNLIINPDQTLNIQHLGDQTQPSGGAESATQPVWRIDIGTVNIRDAETALIDQTTQPPVTTRLSALNGAISGLSSTSLSRADVDFSATFNQYAPVSIAGQINPLSTDAYTNLSIRISDLDLPAFSPYAEQWLAFPILGGKLDLNLQYTLNQAELRGDNSLLFKQFKLGDRVEAPKAIDLPLKLAVSLLTNGKGEMHIDLPVSGNLDDPEFSYSSLVGKALFKLITNIVASPFKILGALIPDPDPNLSDIGFEPGQHLLLTTEQHKLSQIADIMRQKPDLNLRLNPLLNESYDLTGLQHKLLLDKAPFDELDVDQAAVREWLEVQLTPEELLTHQQPDGTINHLGIWQGLLQRQQPDQQAFEALTQARLLKIKETLVNNHDIPPERIFIEQSAPTTLPQSLVRLGVSQ